MATFDQLSDEQRAIVELVLQQGKSYAELSDMLGMPETRVRELARDALVELAPISARAVEQDWRGQLADYVLGQQAGPEATATRGHLRRSEAARSWTRSLLDSLEQLYPDGDVPAIPEGERGRERGAKRAAAAGAPSEPGAPDPRPLSPEAAAAVKRRRIVAGAGAAALILLLAVLLWPIGVLTGDDDEPSSADTGTETEQAAGGGQATARAQGQAIIAEQRGGTQILVTAAGLEPSTQNTAYQVWLYNSEEDRKSLGATVTNEQGALQAGARLPADYKNYKFLDLTAVTVESQGGEDSFKNGPSVMRGEIKLRDKPVTTGKGRNKVTLLAQIEMVPLPGSAG
jgi:Anti-sigma-K factor rskA/Sigma-70, region 4